LTDICASWILKFVLRIVLIIALVDRFTARYKFAKPNDRRALDLMNAAAEAVMKDLPDLCLAYGNSDEFRYVLSQLRVLLLV
jgi:tRNA(His) 5'-end guanylyltransferase